MERIPIVETYLDIDHNQLTTRRVTDQIVIHHTGNPTDDDLSAAEIDASHKARGWACIGYHYVIRKDGTVEQGRPHWTVGAHAYGHNSHTMCVGTSRRQSRHLSRSKASLCCSRICALTTG